MIKNQDLFHIGITNNLENAKLSLKPGQLKAYTATDKSDLILKKLHLRYSEVRLPNSDYFRLTKSQFADCKSILKGEGASYYFEPIFSGLTLFMTFLTSWLALSLLIIFFAIEPILNRFNF